MGILSARPTLYLPALLVLVAVTAGMPGMDSTADTLVLLDDSDWSQGLLSQRETPAQAEAEAEAAEKEAEKEEGSPQKSAAPSDGIIKGNKDQIRALIQATAKKANIPALERSEVDPPASKMAQKELHNDHLLSAIIDAKPAPAPSSEEQKEQAEAQKEALSSGKKSTEQVYHELLTKMATKMPHKMPSVEQKSWIMGSAAHLANTDKFATDSNKASAIAIKTMSEMQQEAKLLAERAQSKRNALKLAEEQQSKEKDAKSELANVARRARAAESAEEKNIAAKVDIQVKAQSIAKKYSQEWLKLKESEAEIRKLDAQQGACMVKLDASKKAADAAQKAVAAASSKVKQMQTQLNQYQTKSDGTKATMEALQSQVKQAQTDSAAANRKSQEDVTTMKAVQAECEQLSARLTSLKSKHEADKTAVAALQDKKKLQDLKLTNAKQVEKSSKQQAVLNKKAMKADITKAVSADHVIQVISATHYCTMKMDAKSKEWSTNPPDFRGSDAEVGNMSNDVKGQCQSKAKCAVKFDQKIEDTGCPQAAFVARYRCIDASRAELELLELGESKSDVKNLEEDGSKEQSLLNKLKSSLAGAGAKVSEKVSLEGVQAALSGLGDRRDKGEQDDSGLLEAKSDPKTPGIVQLECKKPKVPKSLGKAMKTLDKAEKAVEQDDKQVKQAIEASVENAKDKAIRAVEKADKSDAEAKNAAIAVTVAENKNADAKAKVQDLKEKVKEAKVDGKGNEAKVEALKQELKESEEEAQEANAKKKEAENKADRKKADSQEADEERKEAESKTGATGKVAGPSPPGVKAAEEKVEEAKQKVKDDSAKVADIKKLLANTKDQKEVLKLTLKLDQVLKVEAAAKAHAQQAEQQEERQEEMAHKSKSLAEKEKVASANQEKAEAEIKLAELQAKESAARSPDAKARINAHAKLVKEEVKQAEKVIVQDAEQKEISKVEQNQAATEKAEKKVTKAKEELTEDEKQLAELKEKLAQAKGSEEVVALSNKVHDLVVKINAQKKQVSKVEAKAATAVAKQSKQAGVIKKDEGAVDTAQGRSEKLDRQIKDLKNRIKSSTNPDQIPELAKQIAQREAEKKNADRDVASAKAKVVSDVNVQRVSKPQPEKAAAPLVPKAARADPKVMEAKAKEAAAVVARKSAAEEARKLTQEKLKQVKSKLEEKVQQDEKAVDAANRQAGKVNKLLKGLQAQRVVEKSRVERLGRIKDNILSGRDWDAGVVSKKEAALKALGPSPERTAEQKHEAFTRVNTTTPGSATCSPGTTCCVQAFADDHCRVQDQSQCTSDGDAEWKPFLTTAMPIAAAKSITFETRWVKDETEGPRNKGLFLRLRACGEFTAGEGNVCFPKEGAGLQFENFFNSPPGKCTMAKDVFTVAMAGPFKARVAKMVSEDQSANSPDAKVDAASQQQEAKVEAAQRQKKNLVKAFDPEAGDDLFDLVTELMEVEEGEQIMVSAEPLLTLRGSFQISKISKSA